MLDDVITSTTKTASGMIVENGYHRNADVVWRDRKCLFPEGHYMKTTYGLDSLEVKKVGKKIQYINAKGSVLGNEFDTFGTLDVMKFKELLKSLKNVNKMSLNETVKDILRVGKHVRL